MQCYEDKDVEEQGAFQANRTLFHVFSAEPEELVSIMSADCHKRFRCGDFTAMLFLLAVVVAQLPTVDASISLNLKSCSILSNILSPPKSDEEVSDDYGQQ